MGLPEHGANPNSLYEKIGLVPPRDIIDFSENVNPAGPPQSVIDIWPALVNKLSAYPNPTGEPFRTAVAHYHDVSTENIIVGNGAAELIALLAQRYRGKRAIVIHPTFSEYEATLRATDCEIVRISAKETSNFDLPIQEILLAMHDADVLYLCTPNNPTGVLPNRKDLEVIVAHGGKVNCEVVIDEAFIDFVDEKLSFIPVALLNQHVIILRSMTKMYAIPGIRLGYVVANPLVITEIRETAPQWNVNGIAVEIGVACLRALEYREQAIVHSRTERQKMTKFLQGNGCTVTDSVANFLTFKPQNAQWTEQLYTDLLKRGIVLRHSKNFIGMNGSWLRIGMKKSVEMTVLKEELTRWFKANLQ